MKFKAAEQKNLNIWISNATHAPINQPPSRLENYFFRYLLDKCSHGDIFWLSRPYLLLILIDFLWNESFCLIVIWLWLGIASKVIDTWAQRDDKY